MILDINDLALPKNSTSMAAVEGPFECYRVRKPSRQEFKKHGAFIKGPIQLWWIIKTTNLTKSAMKVALAICFFKGIYGNRRFEVEGAIMKRLGIDREETNKGLTELHRAGLIKGTQDSDGLIWVEVLTIAKNKPL